MLGRDGLRLRQDHQIVGRRRCRRVTQRWRQWRSPSTARPCLATTPTAGSSTGAATRSHGPAAGANRREGGNYDDAYQTTGFFLAWLDDHHPDFARKLNAAMKTGASEQTFMELAGKPVQELWQDYQAAIP
jgi:hypothetical protein